MEHRDDHDGNFYNEENSDNQDEHSGDVKRLLDFLLLQFVVTTKNLRLR